LKIKTIQHSLINEAFSIRQGGVKMCYMDKYPIKLANLFNVTVVITIKVMNYLIIPQNGKFCLQSFGLWSFTNVFYRRNRFLHSSKIKTWDILTPVTNLMSFTLVPLCSTPEKTKYLKFEENTPDL